MSRINEYRLRLKSIKRIKDELKNCSKTIVLVGNDKDSYKLDSYFSKNSNYWGKARFDDNNDEKYYTNLAFENITNFIVIIADRNLGRSYEEKLIELGFKTNQFRQHCSDGIGSRLNCYDNLIGYTKQSKNDLPGYVFFPPSNDIEPQKGYYTILTLGGSTTDPGTGNVISWSECLYNELKKYYPNIRVVCAGVNSHVASQELFKLIRDGYLFSPNLVISYSGVNDFSDHYQDNYNPFVLCYTKRIIPKAIQKCIFNEKDVMYSDRIKVWDRFLGRIVKDYSFGIKSPSFISRTDHWIRCEKMMHAVSHSIGADFIGILQPQNFANEEDPKVKMRNSNYAEAKEKLKNMDFDWLLDFTNIFDGKEDIFYDNCHVYGHGNKVIAKKMLPYVITAIKENKQCTY